MNIYFDSIDTIIKNKDQQSIISYLLQEPIIYYVISYLENIKTLIDNPNGHFIVFVNIMIIKKISDKFIVIHGKALNIDVQIKFFNLQTHMLKNFKIGEMVRILLHKNYEIINKILIIIHPLKYGKTLNTLPNPFIFRSYSKKKLLNTLIIKNIQLLKNTITIDPIDWVKNEDLTKYNILSLKKTIYNLHYSNDINQFYRALNRLIIDKWLYLCNNKKQKILNTPTFIKKNLNNIIDKTINDLMLPFVVRIDQYKSIYEILIDIMDGNMFRLLQGDVGTGKTIVMAVVCDIYLQYFDSIAIIVPSKALEIQHFNYFAKLLKNHTVINTVDKNNQHLTSKYLIIGTYGVLNSKFNGSLVMFDEQHKYGVLQRYRANNNNTSILLISATPIPRTLNMIKNNILSLSTINGAKNKKYNTKYYDVNQLDDVFKKVKLWLENGEKIYWVCSSVMDRQNAVGAINRYKTLYSISNKTLLIHGSLKQEVIKRNLEKFEDSGTILVSTTIIEVGINIIDATVIVIENGEYFGLAQLHQLRGRVGRDNKTVGKCLILIDIKKKDLVFRINQFCNMNSGLDISNLDLNKRGAGNINSIAQHGKHDNLNNINNNYFKDLSYVLIDTIDREILTKSLKDKYKFINT